MILNKNDVIISEKISIIGDLMKTSDLSNLIINNIISVNEILTTSGGSSARHNRSCWALLIKYEGETIYTCKNKQLKSNIDSIVILPKGSCYNWVCTKQGHFIVVEFDANLNSENILILPNKKAQHILKLFKDLERTWTLKHQFYKLESINFIYTIMTTVLEQLNNYLPSDKKEKIRPALDYIAQNYNKTITNDELAALLGISTVYFRKLFSVTMGISPINYIQQLRIKKAKEMLKSDYSKISVISEAVGYPNIYHFSKMFKQITGYSPTEYAKNK